MPAPLATKNERRFKIQNSDGSFRKGGKVWTQGTVKLHLRLSFSGYYSDDHCNVYLDDSNAEVVEYELVEIKRIPIIDFINQMHADSEKKNKRHKTPRELRIVTPQTD